MATYNVDGLAAFARLFAKHQREREKLVRGAMKKAASAGKTARRAGGVRRAFASRFTRTVRKSSSTRRTRRPSKPAVRPHTPPLEPLIRWIRLRGAQGLLSPRKRGRLPGTTTRAHAESVAAALRGMEQGGALDVDAPVRLARAIQQAIAKKGTRPHWFARSSLPAIRDALDAFVRQALHV